MNTSNLTPRADVSKCEGRNCDKANECLRYLRPSAPVQWWTDFDLHQPCTHFLEVAKESE